MIGKSGFRLLWPWIMFVSGRGLFLFRRFAEGFLDQSRDIAGLWRDLASASKLVFMSSNNLGGKYPQA